MHQAFYRKYRPQVFDDVCGQDHITSVLRYECAEGNISHAYLFCGSRGTGKTSCAKILAKAINCEAPVNGNPCGKCAACRSIDDGSATDVVEMDAASNNGVDDIRILRDEVHMLSQSAFNALLKTLEEPPEYVVFILATTELHKLPATITSRCQRFDFRRIGVEAISKRLEYIADKENISLAHDAASRIARIAEGGMRDAISLFELCSGGGENVDSERVSKVLGLSGYDFLKDFASAVSEKNLGTLLSMVAQTQSSSKDILVFWSELMSFWRDIMIMKVAENPATYLDLTEAENAALYSAARMFTLNQLSFQIDLFDEAQRAMMRSPQSRRQIAEFTLLKLISPEFDRSVDSLLARISALEEKVSLLEMGATFEKPSVSKPDDNSAVKAEKREENTYDDLNDNYTVVLQDTDDSSNSASDEELIPVPDPGVMIEKLGSNGEMYRPYLIESLIETNDAGNLLRITVENPFAKTFLSSPQASDVISRAAMLARIVTAPPRVEVLQRKREDDNQFDLFG